MMRFLLLLALLIVFYEKVISKRTKYLLDLERMEQCPEPKYKGIESPMSNIKIYRLNGTVRAFNFEFEVKRPWDADVGISLELDVWGYAGWTHVPYVSLKSDFCNTIRLMFPGMLTEVMENMGVEHPDKCPIEPGHYSLQNFTCDNAVTGNNFPFRGKFQMRSTLVSMRTKEVILCTLTVVTTKENVMA